MRYLNFLILTAFVGLSMVVSSCKTKKKSSPAAAPPGELTPGDGDSCENPLALFNAKGLPAASASKLRVSKVFVEEPSIGNSEKIYISSASGSATPDLYIYRGHKSSKVSKYAASYKGVTRASCQPSSTNEECFTGLTFSGLNIDSNIPDGALKIEAWACIGAGGKRVKEGQTYQRVAYRDTVYYCGQAKVSRDNNQHTRKSSNEDILGLINDAIKNHCQRAYSKLTSEKNLQAAKNSSDTVLKSLYGLVAMGPGAFISECVLNLDEIVTAVSYAENYKSSKSGLALTNTGEECEAEVPEEEFQEYVAQTPPPTFNDPVAVIPPVEPDPVAETEPVVEEPAETEEPEVAETPSKRDQCKQRGETLSETIGGNTEWVPDVSSEDKENNGTCFVNHEDGSQTQIEPSIAEQPIEEEPEPAPTPSKKGLSTAQNWGVAFMVIGGASAASAYAYNSNSAVRTRVDGAYANRAVTPTAPLRDRGEMNLRERIIDRFDSQIASLENPLPDLDNEIRLAQAAELENRKGIVLANHDIAASRSAMSIDFEEWNGYDTQFNNKANLDAEVLESKEYKTWSKNRVHAENYKNANNKLDADRAAWDGSAAKKVLDEKLKVGDPFKNEMQASRKVIDAEVANPKEPWKFFKIGENGTVIVAEDSLDSVKLSSAPKGTAIDFDTKAAGSNAGRLGEGRYSRYVRPTIYGGLAAVFLGAVLINFGLSDSSKKDGGIHLVAREARFLAALNSCKKIKDNRKFYAVGCDKVLAAALK